VSIVSMRLIAKVPAKELVQLVVLDSTLPMMAGILKIVRYSVGEMRPMAATALPALDWFRRVRRV